MSNIQSNQNFFIDSGNPSNYVNIGSVNIWFKSKQCSGNPGDQIPDGYLGESQVVSSESPNIYQLRDTCLAYFDVGSSVPSNQANLDALTLQFEQDITNWQKITFDYTFIGILNFAQAGLVDAYEFQYVSERMPVCTRIYTYSFNFRFHELGHYDYQNDCLNSDDTGMPNFDGSPFVYYYGPPALCVNGTLQLTRYQLMLEDGRLEASFVSNDSIST